MKISTGKRQMVLSIEYSLKLITLSEDSAATATADIVPIKRKTNKAPQGALYVPDKNIMKQSTKDKINEGVDDLTNVSKPKNLEVKYVIEKIKKALKEEEKS